MMYGYKLTSRDIQDSFLPVVMEPNYTNLLKFAFAAGFEGTLKLDEGLAGAIISIYSVYHPSFDVSTVA